MQLLTLRISLDACRIWVLGVKLRLELGMFLVIHLGAAIQMVVGIVEVKCQHGSNSNGCIMVPMIHSATDAIPMTNIRGRRKVILGDMPMKVQTSTLQLSEDRIADGNDMPDDEADKIVDSGEEVNPYQTPFQPLPLFTTVRPVYSQACGGRKK